MQARIFTEMSKAQVHSVTIACPQLLAECGTSSTSHCDLSCSYPLSYRQMTSETIAENLGRSFALCSSEMDKEIHINLKSHITFGNRLQL